MTRSGGSAFVAGVCDAVAANGESCAMRFIFLWMVIAIHMLLVYDLAVVFHG